MEKVALFGYPVHHSVSPAMQNAAFADARLHLRYEAVEVAPTQLKATVARLRDGAWQGANVTIPHKVHITEYLDALTEVAVAFGAVNTVFRNGGKLIGDNTDVGGFLADLDAHGIDPRGQTVMLLGSGGAARAVAFALLQRGVSHIRLLGRNVETGDQLVNDLTDRTGGRLTFHHLATSEVNHFSEECGLVVNSTPVGMHPNTSASPWPAGAAWPPHLTLYDLIYNPPETRLMQQARAAGAKAVGGLGMLVHQGALSFTRWTGLRPNLRVMHHAAKTALKESA